ncbi:MAG: cation diffusion facilitator family transporter [Limisphaerales bacterium]
MPVASLTRYAWLSIAAALLTIGLKAGAWWITGSVGLLSDAAESLVNLAGAVMALAMLAIAARPADEDHAYGHGKAEYFSSGLEAALILLAAAGIAGAAVARLWEPRPLENLRDGLAIAVLASAINLVVALVLLRAGRRHHSITLEANAHHLLTDVWTSAGVVVGVLAVAGTGWLWLDPAVALVVAANIVRIGLRIARQTVLGLMDSALDPEQQQAIQRVLDRHRGERVQFHALRTRQSGTRRFISLHVLVPGEWTVQRGHDLLEEIEAELRAAVPNATVFTHLEAIEDPLAWEDQELERKPGP